MTFREKYLFHGCIRNVIKSKGFFSFGNDAEPEQQMSEKLREEKQQ